VAPRPFKGRAGHRPAAGIPPAARVPKPGV